MSIAPPIPIPAEFDDLALADKKAYLAALRARMERDLSASERDVEEAVFSEIERRRSDSSRPRRSREEVMRSLRAKYG